MVIEAVKLYDLDAFDFVAYNWKKNSGHEGNVVPECVVVLTFFSTLIRPSGISDFSPSSRPAHPPQIRAEDGRSAPSEGIRRSVLPKRRSEAHLFFGAF